MTYFKPDYLTSRTTHRWASIWPHVQAAYEAAGLPAPADTLKPVDGLTGAETRKGVLAAMEAAYLDGEHINDASVVTWQQRLAAAEFAAIASGLLGVASLNRGSQHGPPVVAKALTDLAPEFARLTGDLGTLAADLHPDAPLDPAEAIRYGSTEELATVQGILAALGSIASVHTEGNDAQPQERQAIVALAPVLTIPEAGYVAPTSTADVAKGVGAEPLATTATIKALADAARFSLDTALVQVARGEYSGITLALAADSTEIRGRVERITNAFDSQRYDVARARGTQRGYVGSSENAPAWIRYVIGHATNTKAEYVPIGRADMAMSRS